jgi:hypothetical protein
MRERGPRLIWRARRRVQVVLMTLRLSNGFGSEDDWLLGYMQFDFRVEFGNICCMALGLEL